MTRTVRQIDRDIDANRIVLIQRLRYSPGSAYEWQIAWDRNPDLQARDCALFRERDEARDEDIRIAEREHKAALRREGMERNFITSLRKIGLESA
jgi:hypothetical protein